MKSSLAALAVATLLAMLLAGCTADAGGVSASAVSSDRAPSTTSASIAPAPEPVVTEETGAIAGLVVDDEQRPVGGAKVTMVQSLLETLSDAEGRFTVNGLQAGKQTLIASRPGFKDGGREVEVRAGETAEVTIELVPEPSLSEPVIVHAAPWDGMVGCGIGFFIVASADLCSIDAQHQYHFEFEKRLGAVHWEMHWTPANANLARYLRFTPEGALYACRAGGSSPVIGECRLPTEGSLWDSNENSVRGEVRAMGNDSTPNAGNAAAWLDQQSGLAFQQRFRVYITYFHNSNEIPPGFRNGPPS